jgi:hypothetical protein
MPWRARSTPSWLAPVALRRVLTALPRDLNQRSRPGPSSPTQAGGTAKDYATGPGHRQSAANLAPSARRPATVFLRTVIIEAPETYIYWAMIIIMVRQPITAQPVAT